MCPTKSQTFCAAREGIMADYVGICGDDLIIDGWFHERGELWKGQAMSLQVKQVLASYRSKYQHILVFESMHHGNVLVLDGVIQVTERDEFAYQEMITHIPLFSHPNAKNVLVIGAGDGGVLRELAKHKGLETITICEIDEEVINASKKYLPSLACGFSDPRVTVRIMDGNVYMAEHAGDIDLIITDSSDPIGPASVLFETPFYNNMHAALRPGGIICTQGESIWLHVHLIRPLIDSIKDKFESVEYANISIPTYPSGGIGFILATKAGGANKSCKEAINLGSMVAEVFSSLRYYDFDVHKAAFVIPSFAKKAIFG